MSSQADSSLPIGSFAGARLAKQLSLSIGTSFLMVGSLFCHENVSSLNVDHVALRWHPLRNLHYFFRNTLLATTAVSFKCQPCCRNVYVQRSATPHCARNNIAFPLQGHPNCCNSSEPTTATANYENPTRKKQKQHNGKPKQNIQHDASADLGAFRTFKSVKRTIYQNVCKVFWGKAPTID